MAVDLEGRVAVITGGARGMGRAHAIVLAEAGVDIALWDRCSDAEHVAYPLASEADLAETVAAVEARGRKALAVRCDVRDRVGVAAAVEETRATFGRIDILLANAGVSVFTPVVEADDAAWDEVVGVNLTGVYNSIAAVAPVMVGQQWGRIVATSSMLGRFGMTGQGGYSATKWGVIGLVKSAAQELAAHGVTVNAVAPGNIATPMVLNDSLYRTVRPDLDHPTAEDAAPFMQLLHVQPIPWLDPEEVSEAILFLVRSEHVTGSVLDVNAGASARFTA